MICYAPLDSFEARILALISRQRAQLKRLNQLLVDRKARMDGKKQKEPNDQS